MEKSKIWVGAIVIDCTDLTKMMNFWQETLHYVPREAPSADSVILKDPEGVGPNISLNLTNEVPMNDYRIHLDLYSSDPKSEAERLISLGATLMRSPVEGEDFVTLADADGNLFDAIDKKGWRYGQYSHG
jgi:hypothetical protein